MRNARFWGVLLWLFSFQMFVATSGGMLGKYIWLDVVTGLVMFMVSCWILGQDLPGGNEMALASALLLVLTASAVLTFRIYDQVPWKWWDTMTIVAAPQVAVLAISCLLASRRNSADNLQLNC